MQNDSSRYRYILGYIYIYIFIFYAASVLFSSQVLPKTRLVRLKERRGLELFGMWALIQELMAESVGSVVGFARMKDAGGRVGENI